MQGKCSPRTLNTSAAFIVHCAWGIFINLNTRFPFCIVVSFCPIPLIYKDFLLDPFQGPSLQVEILSVCLFVRPSSLLILFLIQTLSSRNLPQSTLVTQLLPYVPHPCLPCPPVNWSPFPVNWSPNEQDHITDLSFQTPPLLNFRAAGEDDKDWTGF